MAKHWDSFLSYCIIGLQLVTSHAIAYMAVQVTDSEYLHKLWITDTNCFLQLRFTLSSAGSWNIINIDLNYEEFYYSIVDYFKVMPGLATKVLIDELLAWWDK